MIAVGFESTRYAPQRSADVCVFLVPVATTDAGYLRFLVHILEFYLVAVLDENLRNVGVVAVTAAADAGRAAVGRHDDPIALIGRACSRSAMLKPVWHCSRLIAALCDGL